MKTTERSVKVGIVIVVITEYRGYICYHNNVDIYTTSSAYAAPQYMSLTHLLGGIFKVSLVKVGEALLALDLLFEL